MSEAERDFLDDDAPEVEQGTPETPEPATPEVAETVDEPAKPEPEAPTAPEVKEEHTVPYAAMKAEREKRQRIEAELAQIRQQQQQFDPQVFHQDPRAISEYVERRLTLERINLSRGVVASINPDYDEVEELFVEEAGRNPMLREEMLRSENPALFAYQTGKQIKEYRQMQDPAAYRERIKAELRAELEAEHAAKEAARAKTAAAIPPDLTDTRNAKGQFAPAPDTVFDEIF